MEFTVYILYSKKIEKNYIGFTENFNQRLNFHLNDSQARKFTYKSDDWVLIYELKCSSKQQALSIEKHIKSMKSKKYIQNLIEYPEISQELLDKYKKSSDC